MNTTPFVELAHDWRAEAELYRRRGQEPLARLAESFAEDLEERVRTWKLEALTLERAAEESGYSYSALQKQVARGEISNAGERGSPRIRRCDLPRKPGRPAPAAPAGGSDLAGELLARRASG